VDLLFNVDLVTGASCHTWEDYEVDGLIPIEFSRTYYSATEEAGVLGPGWTWSWEFRIVRTGSNFEMRSNSPQPIQSYQLSDDADGQWESADGDVLREDSGGYLFHYRDTYRWTYAPMPLAEGVFVPVQVNDAYGNFCRLEYASDRLVALADANGRQFGFEYDSAARLTTIVLVSGGVPSLPNTLVRFQYNGAGDLVTVIDRAGSTIEYRYDRHLLVSHQTKLGGQYHVNYDTKQRCIGLWRGDNRCVVDLSYDDRHSRVLVVQSDKSSKLVTWDAEGQIIEEVDHQGLTVKSVYGTKGDLIATVHGHGITSMLHTSRNGHESKTVMIDAEGGTLQRLVDLGTGVERIRTDTGEEWVLEYNPQGDVQREVTPGGVTTLYGYDDRGLLVTETFANGNIRNYRYSTTLSDMSVSDQVGAELSVKWDEEGRIIFWRPPLSQPTEYDYDPSGAVKRVTLPSGGVILYELNADGNPVRILSPDRSIEELLYSDFGELVEYRDQLQRTWKYDYDAAARLSEVTNPSGEVASFEYDANDNCTSQTFFDGRTERYAYDDQGNIATVTASDGAVSRFTHKGPSVIESDESGENKFTLSVGSRSISCDLNGVVSELKFDTDDRCVTEVQRGREVLKQWDLPGNQSALTCVGLGTRTFHYDLRDRLAAAVDFDSTVFNFEYDEANRLTGIRSPWAQVECRYGPAMRLSSLSATTARESKGIAYEYDLEGRLIAKAWDQFREDYTYDSAGRLVAAARSGQSPAALEWTPTDGLRSAGAGMSTSPILSRDKRGRAVQLSLNGTNYQLHYDHFDNLTGVSASGQQWSFRFDGLGRRVERRSAGKEQQFVWDLDDVIARLDGETGDAETYLWAGKTPATIRNDAGAALLGCASNGYPELLALSDGRILVDTHDVLGVSSLPDGSTSQPFRYCGQYHEVGSVLYYNFYRYVVPQSRSFLTSDPLGLAGDWDVYGCGPDPLNVVDPDGLRPRASPFEVVKCKDYLKNYKKKPKKKKTKNPAPSAKHCPTSPRTSIHNDCMNMLFDKIDPLKAATTLDKSIPGNAKKRPDLQIIPKSGKPSIYVEFDNYPHSRVSKHHRKICRTDPSATIVQVNFTKDQRYKSKSNKSKKRITRGALTEKDCGIDKVIPEIQTRL